MSTLLVPFGGGDHTSSKALEQKPYEASCSQPICGCGHPSTEQVHGPSSAQSTKLARTSGSAISGSHRGMAMAVGPLLARHRDNKRILRKYTQVKDNKRQ
eukprot:scaffold141547_cov41-Tisochrysis_lutea.AAC.1